MWTLPLTSDLFILRCKSRAMTLIPVRRASPPPRDESRYLAATALGVNLITSWLHVSKQINKKIKKKTNNNWGCKCINYTKSRRTTASANEWIWIHPISRASRWRITITSVVKLIPNLIRNGSPHLTVTLLHLESRARWLRLCCLSGTFASPRLLFIKVILNKMALNTFWVLWHDRFVFCKRQTFRNHHIPSSANYARVKNVWLTDNREGDFAPEEGKWWNDGEEIHFNALPLKPWPVHNKSLLVTGVAVSSWRHQNYLWTILESRNKSVKKKLNLFHVLFISLKIPNFHKKHI